MDAVTRKLRAEPAFTAGRAEADAEIAAGKLGFRLRGKLNWQLCEDAAAKLRERFGIDVEFDQRCIASISETAKAEGYNDRMQEEFGSRFGKDVVGAVFREVERHQKKRLRRSATG